MNDTVIRPKIPVKIPVDKSDQHARKISRLINSAVKRAQRQERTDVDEMRWELKQVTSEVAAIEQHYSDKSKIKYWKEILQQLETCYQYIKELHPSSGYDGTVGGDSWSTGWSGRDDNGVI